MTWNKKYVINAGIFLLVCLGFWIISMVYLSPAFDDMAIRQGDMEQASLQRADLDKVVEQTGKRPAWAPNIFGGMPSNLIVGKKDGNLIYKANILRGFGFVKGPFDFLFVAMVSMFVLLRSIKANIALSIAGSIGYAFMTFSVISYEAGHVTKVLAMGAMPGGLAGLVLLFKRKYLTGIAVLAFFFASLIYFFHYQIAFYTAIILGIFGLVLCGTMLFAYKSKLKNNLKHLGLFIAFSVLAIGVSVGTTISKITDTKSYSESTMRGGSKLASETPSAGPKSTVSAKGLNKEYAFSWSYGVDELFTLLIPKFKGGSSNEKVDYVSEFDTDQVPLYHGDLQFTSGPVYLGAVFVVFFIAAFIICFHFLKQSTNTDKKQEVLAITLGSALVFLISIVLALGKNLDINSFFFDYLPYYNKFRTPMMSLAITQVIVPFYSIYGLTLLFSDSLNWDVKKVTKSLLITVGIVLAVAVFATFTQDYSRIQDAEVFGKGAQALQSKSIIMELRKSNANSDLLRTILFSVLALVLVVLGMRKTISKNVVFIGVCMLSSLDLIGVSSRYLNEENWEPKKEVGSYEPDNFDKQIIAENKDLARVLDLRYDPFNDNHAIPFHRNIGGYHPAKLSDYQDVISYAITPNGGQFDQNGILNNAALDMLNCKYILSRNQQTNNPEVFMRNTAFGNAWFVSETKVLDNPKQEIETLINSNLRKTALFTSEANRLKPTASSFVVDSNTAIIKQTNFTTDQIVYESNNPNAGLAVFSEVQYASKDAKWKVFIDDKEAVALKANYILRAAQIPAGKHTIKWMFEENKSFFKTIEIFCSLFILVCLFFAIYLKATNKKLKWLNDQED